MAHDRTWERAKREGGGAENQPNGSCGIVTGFPERIGKLHLATYVKANGGGTSTLFFFSGLTPMGSNPGMNSDDLLGT